jgi:Na+/proline symporter
LTQREALKLNIVVMWAAFILVPIAVPTVVVLLWKRETRKRLEHSRLNVRVERDSTNAESATG